MEQQEKCRSVEPACILFVETELWEQEDLMARCAHHCQVHTREETLQDLRDSDIPDGVDVLSTFVHSRIDSTQLDRLENLKMIATRSTGFDHIDLRACADRDIVVCNVPDYGDNTVAEHAFAMLLALTRKIHRCYERTVRGDFSIDGLRGQDLKGKTFGCLGAGKIGQNALRIAKGFGMHCIAFDINPEKQLADLIGFDYVSFDQLLLHSDVLSVHVPYNEKTHHLVDAEALAKLPKGAIVINTARGGIIEAQALIDALVSGHLGGAALDVLEAESAVGEEAELLSSGYDVESLKAVIRNHALLKLPNVIITPHVAFNSIQAVQRIVETTVRNIHAFIEGRSCNVVHPPRVAAAG